MSRLKAGEDDADASHLDVAKAIADARDAQVNNFSSLPLALSAQPRCSARHASTKKGLRHVVAVTDHVGRPAAASFRPLDC
jgi:hypothetical protein